MFKHGSHYPSGGKAPKIMYSDSVTDANSFNKKAEAEEENRHRFDRSDCLQGTFWVHPEILLMCFSSLVYIDW